LNAAPLFVASTADAETAARLLSNLRQGRSLAEIPLSELAGFAPQAAGMFVPVSPGTARQ
jgi:hypothetical protein